MANRRNIPPNTQFECSTLRQHFNHLRNSSVNMRGILSWGGDDAIEEIVTRDANTEEDPRQKRNVSFDETQNVNTTTSKQKVQPSPSLPKKTAATTAGSSTQNRPRSVSTANKKPKDEEIDQKLRRSIREKQLEEQATRKQERRQKVKKYIEELRPFTRSLTNTKYQDYFDKAALESYGRANVKDVTGGIIYGNHQKTFNMNPHIRGNEPKHYQTHQTAINYGKRTKINEEDKWSKLQKELSKKLGLKDKNETLKQGKQVVVIDIDDSNMYSIMRENQSFKKEHQAKIRNFQVEYIKGVQEEKKAAVQQFFADKKARIMSGNTVDSQNSQYVCPRDERGRLQQQVIYRHTDKNGVVRIGADRHALTCFVDMNFPQNDAAYTQELINRMSIYPVEVEDKDKFIDDQRRNNYQKSLENIYPSHYLVPNCDQPEVIKMVNNKYGDIQHQQQKGGEKKNLASTFGTTRVGNSSLIAH